MSFIFPAGGIRKRKIIRAFLEAGAVSADTAKTLDEVDVIKGMGLKFEQLINSGAIVSCENGKYYVDKSKL